MIRAWLAALYTNIAKPCFRVGYVALTSSHSPVHEQALALVYAPVLHSVLADSIRIPLRRTPA